MRRRVALVSSSFAPYVGGVEEHVRRVATELQAVGLDVEIWTVDRGEALGTRDVEGVTVRYLPTPLPRTSPGAALGFLFRLPSAWRSWANARRRFQPDLLHVHCFGPNGAYALAVGRRFKVPLIITSHGETIADDHAVFERSALLRWALRRGLRVATAVTAPSRFVIDDLRAKHGLIGGTVVPNGVVLDGLDRTEGPAPTGRFLLGVGRLGRMKGFDLLIDAFARATLDRDIRLVIAGDGPELERLQKRAEQLGVARSVEFTGRLDTSAVARTMANALAVVVPSRVEAFGIVALEAWRSGAPLIMTNRGGAPEFLHDDVDAILVDPEDTAALCDALSRVSADDALRSQLVAAGRERVGEFTWARVASAYARLYASASARAGGEE